MPISVTISADSSAELKKLSLDLTALLHGGTSATVTGKGAAAEKDPAPLTASDKSRLRGDATVVEPKPGAGKGKNKKAEEPQPEPEAEAEDETSGDESGDEASGEEETFSEDDVRAVLLEAKEATKDPAIIGKIVQKFGAKKLSELKPEKYAETIAYAKEQIAAAKKTGKKK